MQNSGRHSIGRGALLGLLFISVTCSAAFAQNTAQISGSVKDPSGAVLPGVEVNVTQADTAVTRSAVSDETGAFLLPNLPIGPYRLEAKLPGFKTFVQTGIVLQVGANPTINVTLELGQISEQIEVQADAALVETRSTGVGQVIDNVRVLEMPLNGRQVTELILLSGAAIGGLAQTPAGRNYPTDSISVGGGLNNGLLYLLDGGTHNDPFNNLNLPLPFPDALQEFKVETSALTAQYGQHSSAAVNAVTKSGTNEFHGDLFEFVRNGSLNARNAFALQRDSLKRNQFGGVIGGPVIKNKLFFFGGEQTTLVRSAPLDLTAFVPTAAMLAGDWTAVTSPACNGGRSIALRAPFMGNRISPTQFSPAALNLLKQLPAPIDDCGTVKYGSNNKSNEHTIVSKVDYQWSPKQSLFGRYEFSRLDLPTNYNGISVITATEADRKFRAQSLVLGDTYLLGPNVVNSLRATVLRTVSEKTRRDYFTLGDLGVKNFYYPPDMPKVPQINVAGAFVAGSQNLVPGVGNATVYQVSNDISLVRGKHQIGLGANYIYSMVNILATSFAGAAVTFSATNTNMSLGDLMLGRMNTYTQGSVTTHYPRQDYLGTYLQDTWKATSRLTINAGIRWEPFLAQHDKEGRILHFQQDWFDQGLRSGVFKNAPVGLLFPGDAPVTHNNFMATQWLHFAPRVGLALDPRGDGRMTVRAAYGIFYDYPHMYQFNGLRDSPPWGSRVILSNPAGGFDDPWQGQPGGNPFPLAVNANSTFPPSAVIVNLPLNLRMPYVNQWNLSVQRQIGEDWLLAANYIGSSGIHVLNTAEGNPAVFLGLGACVINGVSYPTCSTTGNTAARRALTLKNPAQGQYYGAMVNGDDGGTRSYNGLLVSIQRRAGKSVTLNTNYTWAHCIDDGQQTLFQNGGSQLPERRRVNRGNCDSDRRHNFNLSTVYSTPQFANATLRTLATGWKLGGILRVLSGSYLNVTSGLDQALTGVAGEQRPNQLLANPLNADKSGDLWINPAAFAQPALGTYGNLGSRNILGPGSIVINTNLTRTFQIREKQSVEFRVESFNLPNHVNPINPNTVLSNSTFGKILNANDPRIMQLALKYVF